MTNSSAESEPDVSLVGLGGWFVFLWGVSQVFPGTWKVTVEFRWLVQLRSFDCCVGRGRSCRPLAS